MKIRFFILAAILMTVASCTGKVRGDGTVSSIFEGQVDYHAHFTAERLRVDITFCGDKTSQGAYLNALYREGKWSGNPASLIDTFGYGQYYFELFEDGKLIYSKGFSTLFEEWRTTEQAAETPMSASQSLWMPFPKHKVHFVLYQRIRESGKFVPLLEFDIDPSDRHIVPIADNKFAVKALRYHGDESRKVDLVFAGEGYTISEMQKLRSDAMRMTDYIFSMEPYASRKNDFNIWLVESASEDSGTDIPQEGIWRNTVMDSMFDTFYIDRYLTVMDHTKIADAVSCAPADAIIVLVNTAKYGGAGMYGSYAMTAVDNPRSLPVVIHEFGHSFAGLADEYYDSEVAYEEYYPLDVEPWEPNLTTDVDFGSKWQDMIDGSTPVPTPNDSSYINVVGLFEGGGYMTYGCYRPYFDCRMKTNTAAGFCPVCQRAISRMIDYYSVAE